MRDLKTIVLTVFASNMTVAGLTFLLQVLMARLLPVSGFGRLSLLLSLVAIIKTVVVFGFPGSAVVHYGKEKDKEKAMAAINGWFLVSLALVSCVVVPTIFILDTFYRFGFLERAVLLASVVGMHIYEYRLTRRQMQGHWSRYNQGLILNALLKFVLALGTVYLYCLATGSPFSLDMVLVGYLGWAAVIILLGLQDGLRWSGIEFPWRLEAGKRRDFLHLILNLGLTNTFAIMSMRSANLIVEYVLGSQALGIFAAANTLALIMPVLTSSMMRVFIREAAHDGQSMLRRIMAAQRRYAVLVLVLAAAGFWLSRPLILLVFGERYQDSAEIFRWLLLAYIGGVVFTPLESYFYANQQSMVMKVKGLQMAIITLGCYLAASYWGLPGVPAVLILARIVGWSILWTRARRLARAERSPDSPGQPSP